MNFTVVFSCKDCGLIFGKGDYGSNRKAAEEAMASYPEGRPCRCGSAMEMYVADEEE